MLLPLIITTGLLTSAVTPVVVPSPAALAPPPRTPVDTLLKEDTISSPYAWEHPDSCNWHTGISPSTFICGRPLICVTNNDDAVACTVSQDPPRSSHTTCSELESNHSENDGFTALTGERASIFWTVSMMRSMIACDSTDTVMSLFDRPAYIAAKSTSSEMASSEPTSGQTTFGKPITSKSTSSSTSSSSPVSSTSSTSTKPTISSTTASMSSSSQEPTPSTGASASSIKTSLSSTTLSSSSSATTSSSSSDISSDVTTMTSPDSTTFSTEAVPTSTQSSTAPVIISQTSTITQTTTSTPAPTYSLGVPINPPAADTASLSIAAKAGIGAGAGVVLLLLLTAVALVLLRKRRARDEPVQHNTWPMRDRSDGPAAVAQKRRLWLPRPFWQRGPRSDANVAVDDNDDDDDDDEKEEEEEEGEMDAGIGGSEVPVVAMHGQGHAGGGGELDEHPGAALGLAPPPRRSPAPRDAWRSSHHHHHHYHPPPAEPARAPAGWHGASSTASPGWWGWQDQQHGRIPGEVHSPAGQLHNWHGSNVAWGTS